jgi:hypothetical protein
MNMEGESVGNVIQNNEGKNKSFFEYLLEMGLEPTENVNSMNNESIESTEIPISQNE